MQLFIIKELLRRYSTGSGWHADTAARQRQARCAVFSGAIMIYLLETNKYIFSFYINEIYKYPV